MRLHSLHLQQFRTYRDLTLELAGADLHFLLGQNGAGKTNLLEAVSVLSLTRSFRGSDDEDMLAWETDHYRIRGEAQADDGTKWNMEVVSTVTPRKRRACFLNDVQKPISEYAGALPVVGFLPEDLGLFRGPPAERRRFLDQLLSQVSPDYLLALSSYQQVLKQRNALLKELRAGGGDQSVLQPWEEQLAASGAVLTTMRLELLQTINLSLEDELSRLGERWGNPKMMYDRQTEQTEMQALEDELRFMLKACRARDIEMVSTSVGPHREDWQIEADGRPIPAWASRGQERVALIALLLLQVAYLELRRGEKPVILLDDVLSELDDSHQHALLTSLAGHQILISGTHVPAVESLQVWDVKDGSVTRR